jgi:hypothetical protein
VIDQPCNSSLSWRAQSSKLAIAGLLEARDNSTLVDFTASYIRRRTDIKPRTRINLEQCQTRLLGFVGAKHSLRFISPGDDANRLLWFKESYADDTTERAVKRATQFFRAAVPSK